MKVEYAENEQKVRREEFRSANLSAKYTITRRRSIQALHDGIITLAILRYDVKVHSRFPIPIYPHAFLSPCLIIAVHVYSCSPLWKTFSVRDLVGRLLFRHCRHRLTIAKQALRKAIQLSGVEHKHVCEIVIAIDIDAKAKARALAYE